jgi:hypothetical protein
VKFLNVPRIGHDREINWIIKQCNRFQGWRPSDAGAGSDDNNENKQGNRKSRALNSDNAICCVYGLGLISGLVAGVVKGGGNENLIVVLGFIGALLGYLAAVLAVKLAQLFR